jgi:hypothetical protein
MKLTAEKIELLDIDGNSAYFHILDEKYLEFEIEFNIDYTYTRGDSSVGIPSGYECSYFSVQWISYIYDTETNEDAGEVEGLKDNDFKPFVTAWIEQREHEHKYEI